MYRTRLTAARNLVPELAAERPKWYSAACRYWTDARKTLFPPLPSGLLKWQSAGSADLRACE